MNDTNTMEEQSELTVEEVLSGKKKENKSIEELLFPPLPDDYFKNNDGIQFDNRNPIEKAIDTYNNASIKPYIRSKKLGGDGDPVDDTGRKSALEIGINFSF